MEQQPPEDELAGSSSSSCTNCDAYLQGKCNPSEHQLLFHVCKLRTGTRREKEEAAKQLGELAKESVRSAWVYHRVVQAIVMPPPPTLYSTCITMDSPSCGGR